MRFSLGSDLQEMFKSVGGINRPQEGSPKGRNSPAEAQEEALQQQIAAELAPSKQGGPRDSNRQWVDRRGQGLCVCWCVCLCVCLSVCL